MAEEGDWFLVELLGIADVGAYDGGEGEGVVVVGGWGGGVLLLLLLLLGLRLLKLGAVVLGAGGEFAADGILGAADVLVYVVQV